MKIIVRANQETEKGKPVISVDHSEGTERFLVDVAKEDYPVTNLSSFLKERQMMLSQIRREAKLKKDHKIVKKVSSEWNHIERVLYFHKKTLDAYEKKPYGIVVSNKQKRSDMENTETFEPDEASCCLGHEGDWDLMSAEERAQVDADDAEWLEGWRKGDPCMSPEYCSSHCQGFSNEYHNHYDSEGKQM